MFGQNITIKNRSTKSEVYNQASLGHYQWPSVFLYDTMFCSPSKYSKTCVKQPFSKRPQIGFQDRLSLNAGQKYCRMLQGEHSAILSTFIQLPFVIKMFVFAFFLSGCFTQVLLYLDQPGHTFCQRNVFTVYVMDS